MATERTTGTPAEHTRHDEAVAPQLAELKLADKPDGPAAAAMVAAGIGVFALGLLTTLAAASEGFNESSGGSTSASASDPLPARPPSQ